MNEKKNINEADIAAVARIRKLIDQQSDIEDKIELFAAEAQNLNDPQKLFTNFDKIIKDLKRRLARLNAIFPTLNPVLDIVGRTNRLGIDDAGDIDDAESAIDRLSLDEEASSEADRRRQERARRRVRGRTRSILKTISFEDYIKNMGKVDYAELAREVEKSLLEGFTGLARRRIDPVVFFERNPSVVSDVRGIYQILSLANAIGIAVEDFRVKLRSAYADEGDADAFINRILTTDNQLLTDFRKEFAEIDFPELVKKQKRNFNDRFLVKLQGLSDVAAGSKQAADRQRRGELEAIAQASRKKKLREALLKEDEDLEAAMRELQSNPATATEQEISQMMRGEIPRAATASELSDLRGIINSLITSYGSLNNWREEQSNNFKNRFIDLAKSDVQRATSQLEQVLNILLEQMTDILDDTLQNWSDKLIKFRSDKVIPAIIKARNENDEAMLNKTKAYNRELSKVLIDLSDIRKKFISKHKKIISEKPELYKIFLQTAESKLDITVKQRVNEFLENFAKIKSGEEPTDPTPSETESSDSLKDMPADKIYVALNQLANKGISADILINQFEDAIAKMYEDAGPLKDKFKEEDEPIILKIKNELAKILDGDFSNLINENKILLHPVTYNLILRAYNNLIQEALMGSMPERYINAIYQWLLLKDKYTPEKLNKFVSYIENSEKAEAKKILIAMIKQIKELRKIDQQPAKSEFKLSDQWQEVPEDALMPPGVEYRMDLAGEKTYARLIKENCNIQNNSNVDVSQLENMISHFYPYVKEKLKFNKDATVRLVTDPENAKNAWGKTAQYNPNTMEITIFVDGRHPKDMLRSISHELVHHAQNCRGEFDKTQALEQGYAQKDPHMRRMEGEAYLLGNGFLVRDFEDYLKSQQNQNLTENKKMKGLTNEQLRTVLENTINRITKEGFSGAMTAEPAMEEGETDCAKLAQRIRDGLDTVNQYGQGGDVVERDSQAYQAAGCPPLDGMGNPVKEEVVEEEAKNMVDCDGKMVPDYACDGKGKDDLKESFTSKKDQLLFERLTNKWAK